MKELFILYLISLLPFPFRPTSVESPSHGHCSCQGQQRPLLCYVQSSVLSLILLDLQAACDTLSWKRLLHLTSKTPAVLEFLSGGSFWSPLPSPPFLPSFSELECSRIQSLNLFSVYRPSLVISTSFVALNAILICLLRESSLSLQSCSPSFSILASASGGGLYVIYQQASLCLLVGCEQW